MLHQLDESSKNAHLASIGPVFVNNIHYFRLYQAYVANYTAAVETLNEEAQQGTLATKLRTCRKNPIAEKQDLDILLLQPVNVSVLEELV